MSLTLITWRLAELMARHRVKGTALAKKLDVNNNAVTNMKRSRTMPRITGEKLNELLNALNELADPETKQDGKRINLTDLMDWVPDHQNTELA